MPYRRTQFYGGGYYHVYNRGNNHQDVFFERENYLFFLRQMRKYLTANVLDIIAYCLMPNHYHLLISITTEGFPDLMQPFLLSYTKAINERYHRVGSLFQGRFKAILVDNEAHLLQLSRYIHLNPVVDRLVKRPDDWEFSSYREFIGSRNGTLAKPDVVLSYFQSPEDYRNYVASSIDHEAIEHLVMD
jgi:putative transposase